MSLLLAVYFDAQSRTSIIARLRGTTLSLIKPLQRRSEAVLFSPIVLLRDDFSLLNERAVRSLLYLLSTFQGDVL